MAAPSALSSPAVRDLVSGAQAAGGLTPSPEDWRDRWIYFLMVDRFNHPGAAPRQPPWDNPEYSGYQGGTFGGVEAALPYIRDLGAGAIWLSPVLKNLPFDPFSYHGYGIHDFLHAEPRFASDPAAADDELGSLVDAAHRLDLRVIFDIVLNHTGNAFAYDCDPSDALCGQTGGGQASFRPAPAPVRWRDALGRPAAASLDAWPAGERPADALVWPAELQEDAYFRRQGVPAPDGDDTIGDFQTLKQMRTDDATLQELLIRCYRYVIARWDVDGFRIDTLRFLKGGLPRLFGGAVREFALTVGKKNFFTFGEVFDPQAEQDIARFIGRNTAAAGDLVGVDAALDYPLYSVLPSIAKGMLPPARLNDTYLLRRAVEHDVVSSHGDATRFFVTFLDNHDVKRRLRYVEPDGKHPYDDQVTLALACLFALPGVPCVYYGTEQGLHGAGPVDAAVRESLWAGPGLARDGLFYAALAAIAAARAEIAALRYGRLYLRPVSGDGVHYGLSQTAPGVLAFSRILSDQEAVVAANTSTTADQTLDVVVDQSINAAGDQLRVRYSNLAEPVAPAPLTLRTGVTVAEPDGSTGSGPVLACRVSLRPMEVQILTR